MEKSFEIKLRELINSTSKDNELNTPDYILAEYLSHCLDAFNMALLQIDQHNKSKYFTTQTGERFKVYPTPSVQPSVSQPKISTPSPVQKIVSGMATMDDIIIFQQAVNSGIWNLASHKLPPLGEVVEVKLASGEIRQGKYDDDVNRSCWLIKGTGGLFWRSMIETVEYWRKIK